MATTAPKFAPSGFTAEDRVAQNILDQIGVPALMGLGAHNVTRYLDAVTFNAKIAKPGQTRARKMLVKITLNRGSDLYDFSIGCLEKKLDWYSLYDLKGIDAETMVGLLWQHR